jgi:hypothetical protein
VGDEVVRFAQAFFVAHGATWEACGPGLVEVRLPTQLAETFGSASLRLALEPGARDGALSPAPGGRVFDAMLAHLGARGRCAALTRRAFDHDPARLTIVGAEVQTLPPERADRVARIYDFQLSFLSDERRDVLWSVALDEAGRRWDEPLAWLNAAGLLDDLPAAAAERAAVALAEGLAVAETFARAHAEREAAGQEAEAAERLSRARRRLEAYYADLQAELPSRRRPGMSDEALQAGLAAARRELAAELEGRLEREAQRHRLRVLVRALGHAAVVAPGVRLRWRLTGARRARELTAWQDLASGHVAWPPCERCGGAEGRLGMCSAGHVVCPECLVVCHGCGQSSCAPELTPCGCCEALLCAGCVAQCGGGHPCCALHLVACGCCGRVTCERCATPCIACGSPLAPAHPCRCRGRTGALSPG